MGALDDTLSVLFSKEGRTVKSEWADPRYAEMVQAYRHVQSRTTRGPSKRRRTCSHGTGVTVMVHPTTKKPTAMGCPDCIVGK